VRLSSNQELYDYLLSLASRLSDRGAIELSKTVRSASKQAASMPAEFLGESRIALRQLLSTGNNVLDASEQADIEDVLRQLTAAINRWPQGSK
jgi:hypothetical protein